MPVTTIRGAQVRDATINRDDLDVATVGKAVVAKIIAGTNVTLSSTGADSGTGDVTINATGGGGSANVGTATLNFGAFPGASDTSVAVTGQTGIVSGSVVNAWIRPVATADHSADEHMLETLKVVAGNIVAGTGFTIYGFNESQMNEPVEPYNRGGKGGNGTRLWGQFTVGWQWA